MPKKIFSLPRDASVSSRFSRARSASGSGRSASLMPESYAGHAIRSKMEDYVSHEDELVVIAAEVIGLAIIRMIVTKFRPDRDQSVRPPGKTDRVLGILGVESSAASNLIVHVFISYRQKRGATGAEHRVIQDRPLRRITA